MSKNKDRNIVGIAITSFNYGHYINEAVESVINQTSPFWQLTIYENGSTDNTLEVLKPYLKDDRINLIVHDENIGMKDNITYSIRDAKVKYFSPLQADDFLEESFVEKALEQFEQHPDSPFVFFDWHQYIDSNQQRQVHSRHPFDSSRSGPISIGSYLTVCNFIPFHMAVFNTAILQNEFLLVLNSPLNQVIEQYLFKLLEDKYGYGCYSGSLGGVWRRHGAQVTEQQMASGVAIIEEPLERHWYATMAPNPNKTNVFLALVNFIKISSQLEFFVAAKWLMSDQGRRYTESFNISLETVEKKRLQGVVLAIAVKYTVFTVIKLCTLEGIKDWLNFMGVSSSRLGFKQVLDSVLLDESELFINEAEIKQICDEFFPCENEIAVIFNLTDVDNWQEQGRALKSMARKFDLYVSISIAQRNSISPKVLEVFPNAYIYEVPENTGSVFSFLSIVKDVSSFKYKSILRLNSPNNSDEESVYQELLDRCLENDGVIDVFNKNSELGIYAAKDSLRLLAIDDEYLADIKSILSGFKSDFLDKNEVIFSAESMFWFRPEALKFFLELDLSIFKNKENIKKDIIDRLVGVACSLADFSCTDRLSKYDDKLYQIWLENKRISSLSRYSAICAEPKNVSPLVHLLMFIDANNLSLLADTLDSLSDSNYTNWHLSILSSLPCPDSLFNELPQISWVTVEENNFDFKGVLLSTGIESEWFSFIEAGDYIEPHGLLCCIEYLTNHPEWKIVYTDEDSITRDGFFHNPKFKPDFNLDLFYSIDYVGGLVLFKSDALIDIEGIYFLTPIISYDLILNYIDLFGEKIVGHISEVLTHRKEYVDELILSQSEMRKRVLFEHFSRNNNEVKIDPGFKLGSFYIKFPVKQQPMVSIIISTHNELKFLRQCIDSIFDKTSYENFEVIIIDNNSEEIEVLEYLEEVKLNNPKVKLISRSFVDSYSAIDNAAVEQASGAYVLLLNNDTVVLQEEWLQGLLSNVQRDQVGIVAARLVSPLKKVEHAGLVLGAGKTGVVGQANLGVPMDQVGYMGRAMAMQELSAVSSACLMMEKRLYQKVLGKNEGLENALYSDVDLCLKVRDQSYKIILVPYVTLIHHGLRYHSKKISNNKLKQQAFEKETDFMLEHWLPQLANDPAYNRNLSLKNVTFKIDTSMGVSWNVDLKSKPKIYAFPLDSSGVGQYRVRGPIGALDNAGVIESSLANNWDNITFPTPVEIERIKPDVLLIQNAFLDHMLDPWKKYYKFNDAFKVCGLDDLVYMLPDKHPKQGQWPKNTRRKVKELFQCSDRVIVANEALAEEYRKMTNEVLVVPNYLERWRWCSVILPKKKRSKKLRVGWAGGHEHVADLEFIRPIVKALHKEVDWVFMGLCLDGFEPYIKERHYGVEFDLYPQKLADLNLDLAIAPLMHNRFNECKTNLRLLEFGIMGWPVVCTDILPYKNAPVTRVANNVNEWIRVIREKINEPDDLQEEGAELRRWVMSNYMLDEHLGEWRAALLPN